MSKLICEEIVNNALQRGGGTFSLDDVTGLDFMQSTKLFLYIQKEIWYLRLVEHRAKDGSRSYSRPAKRGGS